MAKYSNPGTVNIDAATKSILESGGGINEKTNPDGSKHVSVYNTDNRHFSYDKDSDGNISNVHSSIGGNAHMDYKGGK